mgnify:CR=1 FL=1
MKDNSTGKNKDFYDLGKQMFDRLNSQVETSAPNLETMFRAEFAGMMRKYKINEMYVLETVHGLCPLAEGIEIEFNGIYKEDGETIRPSFNINIGNYITPETIEKLV